MDDKLIELFTRVLCCCRESVFENTGYTWKVSIGSGNIDKREIVLKITRTEGLFTGVSYRVFNVETYMSFKAHTQSPRTWIERRINRAILDLSTMVVE